MGKNDRVDMRNIRRVLKKREVLY